MLCNVADTMDADELHQSLEDWLTGSSEDSGEIYCDGDRDDDFALLKENPNDYISLSPGMLLITFVMVYCKADPA